MDIPLEILDVEVARAAADLSTARARLARGEIGEDNPLAVHRRASERATFLALSEPVAPSAPALPTALSAAPDARLAAALRRWVYALTLERVLWTDTVRLADAWHAPTIHVEGSGVAPIDESPRDLCLRVLREPDDRRRRIFDQALAGGSVAVRDAARILADRRVEAARLLGAPPDAIEIPVDPPHAVAELASRFLSETEPMAERASVWSAALFASTGRAFAFGWPARLGVRWLFELFGQGPLTEGLALSIPRLPAALGAASFARALGALGAALADVDGPLSTLSPRARGVASFSLARGPFDLVRARRAALFASLAADPVFGVRALGLAKGMARDQARGVARALLLSLRLDAARVLCRGALSLPGPELAGRFEEVTATALGAPIPPSLAGVVPRLAPADPSTFAGALLAARDRRRLVDAFDEDWFRNPRAAVAIRTEDADVPASHTVPRAELEAGLAEIVRALGEL